MFCKYCGNSVRDEAYVCPFCGGQLKELPDELLTECVLPPQPSRKFYRLAKIFSIIGTVLSGVTLFCGLLFVMMFVFGLNVLGDGGLLLVIYSVFALLAMVVFAPFALVTGILAFVFSRKSLQPTGKFPIVAFVFGITVSVIGFGTYILLILP